MISDGQCAHFKTFGFLILKQAFSCEEMEAITRDYDLIMEKEEEQPSDNEKKVKNVVPFVEKLPQLARLAEDDRIYGTMEKLLGPGFIWAGSEGQNGRASADWHTDRPGREELFFTRIKTHLYLDVTTEDAGALRVIPGSHRMPLHDLLVTQLLKYYFKQSATEDVPIASNALGVTGPEMPSFPLESTPGDIVFFNQSLFHAVYGGRGRQRRYIALKYAENPVTDKHIASLQKWTEYVFHPDEVFLNSERPRIRSMIDGLVGLTS